MDQLWAISYASVAARPLSPSELDALLQDAQGFNQGAGVSGVLCYDNGVFIQYFEGPEAGVRRVYERIRASAIHRQLEELSSAPIAERQFDGWHMAFCQAPETLLLFASPLYVAIQRYVPTAVGVNSAEVAEPPLSGRSALVKIAAFAHVASFGP